MLLLTACTLAQVHHTALSILYSPIAHLYTGICVLRCMIAPAALISFIDCKTELGYLSRRCSTRYVYMSNNYPLLYRKEGYIIIVLIYMLMDY